MDATWTAAGGFVDARKACKCQAGAARISWSNAPSVSRKSCCRAVISLILVASSPRSPTQHHFIFVWILVKKGSANSPSLASNSCSHCLSHCRIPPFYFFKTVVVCPRCPAPAAVRMSAAVVVSDEVVGVP